MASALLFVAFLGTALGPGFASGKEGKGKEEDQNPVVARVNRHEIRLSDVYASIESFPLGDQINMRKRVDLVLQSLVNEELLFQSLLASNSEWDQRLRNEIKALVVERLIQRWIKERVEVSDAEIREYYNENRDTLRGWHVRVRHILLQYKADCEDMLQRINSEEAFAEMAKAHSLDRTSAAKGGDLGFMMYSPDSPQSLGFELEFFEMELGEMRIFESENGCHLIRIVNIDNPPDPSFAEIRAFLKPKLEERKEPALLQELIEKASRDANVEIFSAKLK